MYPGEFKGTQTVDNMNMNSQLSPAYQQAFQEPPPSYAVVAQSSQYSVPVQQQVSPYGNTNSVVTYPTGAGTPSSKAYKWPRQSVGLVCPRCGATVTTRVETAITIITLIGVLICCCITCVLGWLPLCLSACKKVTHYCPYCSSILGVRNELR
ncbi:unnamed protein product [Rotaria magnacalcarata]|uniref:LITAF domain-containing protein n=3 Tax=Rotaria magnacalcarata TaxID=392030 RepID=A0A814R7H2_9BILA|nr:unnamed protein product [Rotaria magnacalcarata]CAF1569415.1 unnamed protein product [Rotaria magnacalcarata]CAF4075834.1 unnamed protein product [Rotaria magnacalcarata]